MINLKCKSCGEIIPVDGNHSSVVCPSCGNTYEIPLDEKKEKYLNLYSRADDAWDHKDFEEATGLYEQILAGDNTQAEAHFGLVMCKYGITYEIDPVTQKKMPTCNRINRDSILDDPHFRSALKYASKEAAASFRKRAEEIDRISSEFLKIVDKEPPYDVFISYKRTAEDGSVTQDSKNARKLYYHLRDKGFKVFFAEETLKSVAGEKFEPYIFAALSSAPVMVLIGSKREYFEATWVKNEWRRYLALIRQGQKKTLIPAYFEMDPYSMPGELRGLQAMNAADITFREDVTEIIRKKVADARESIPAKRTTEQFPRDKTAANNHAEEPVKPTYAESEPREEVENNRGKNRKWKKTSKAVIIIAVIVIVIAVFDFSTNVLPSLILTNVLDSVVDAENSENPSENKNLIKNANTNLIKTVADLSKLSGSGETYQLGGDIDLDGVAWTPIEGFNGTLNGNGYTIKNLTVEGSSSNVGFFGTLSGTVKDVNFDNAKITVTGSKENVGILCGQLSGSASGVSVSGSVDAASCNYVGGIAGSYAPGKNTNAELSSLENKASVKGAGYVGGIVGYIKVKLSLATFNSLVNAGAIASTGDYAGGIVGYCLNDTYYGHKIEMSDSTNSGDVSGNNYVGGIFGYSTCYEGTIKASSSSSTVTGKAYIGCIAGEATNILIDNCKNTGSVIVSKGYTLIDGTKYSFVGGFVGKGSRAANCVNEVEIDCTSGGYCVGGILGSADMSCGDNTLSSLENKASVEGTGYVGGIVGYIDVKLSLVTFNSLVNAGAIASTGDYAGGIVGYCRNNLYWGHELSGVDCTNKENVKGSGFVGGIFGYVAAYSGRIYDCTSTGKVSGTSNCGNIAGLAENVTVE